MRPSSLTLEERLGGFCATRGEPCWCERSRMGGEWPDCTLDRATQDGIFPGSPVALNCGSAISKSAANCRRSSGMAGRRFATSGSAAGWNRCFLTGGHAACLFRWSCSILAETPTGCCRCARCLLTREAKERCTRQLWQSRRKSHRNVETACAARGTLSAVR